MAAGRYGGSEKRRSRRFSKRFKVEMEYEGKIHEIRTIDISEHGVLIPKRIPPPVGTRVTIYLTIRDEKAVFEGVVKRLAKCLVNRVQTTGIGIDISSPEYQEFVKDKILLSDKD